MTASAVGPSRPGRPLTMRQWFRRALVVFALLILIATVSGGFVVRQTHAVTEELVDRAAPAAVAAGQLRGAVVDQETGVRGYLLTRDRTFLSPYHDGYRTQLQVAGTLRGLLLDDPRALAALRAVGNHTAQWRSDYAAPVVTQGVRPTEREIAAGDRRFDAVRTALDALDHHLLVRRNTARAAAADAVTWNTAIFVALLAMVVLGGAVAAIALRRGIVDPLQQVGATTSQVAGGSFDRRISVEGPAELQDLAADVDGMRQRIVTELARVRTAHDNLEEQARELRRSNAELEQFAYVASHDLQEPLRKVTSFCQLIERRYGNKLDDRGRQYIEYAVDGAMRMQILINDLLAFSRVGRLGKEHADVDLEMALSDARSHLQTALKDSRTRLSHDPLPTVHGDRTLLTMLLQNLLHNAVKFSEPDTPPHITVTCERHGDAWQLAVTDRGIGIPAEFRDKVFIIFQRLHTRDAYPGTGIGLAICKKIVEYHGGRMWLDTGYGDGTRICFSLPARPGDGTAAP